MFQCGVYKRLEVCKAMYFVLQADKIATLCKAAGVTVETIWPNLFAKALQGKWKEGSMFVLFNIDL